MYGCSGIWAGLVNSTRISDMLIQAPSIFPYILEIATTSNPMSDKLGLHLSDYFRNGLKDGPECIFFRYL